MGTQTSAGAPRTQQDPGGVTPGMKWVIATVGGVVVAGLSWAAWTMSVAGHDPTNTTTASEGASPTSPSGASPGATPVDGSEVIAPAPGQSDSARLPALPQPTPLINAPLPPDAAAQGAVVDGFPVALAAPVPDSDVIDSSIASDGAAMQATLNGRSDHTPAEIVDHYRQLWSALGLAPVSADDGTVAYADQFTSITLAARESGTGTVYTLYATLRTE